MTLKDSYVCPVCGKAHSRILLVQTLMDDVRYDVFKCEDCGGEWRVYYKVTNITTEVTYTPAPAKASDAEESETESDTDGKSAEATEEQ